MKKNILLLFILLFTFVINCIASDKFKVFRLSSGFDANEPSIAINPVNPLNIAAGANLNYVYISTDGGKSWSEKVLKSARGQVWGDPCLIFDVSGNLHYGHLNYATTLWLNEIIVQSSTDGGNDFSIENGVGANAKKQQDKEWFAVDFNKTSPYYKNIYMSWTEFDKYASLSTKDSTRVRFARSTDGGITWAPVVITISDVGGICIDSDNAVEGAVPAVGPNGDIYVTWSGTKGLNFDKSTDGGKTFGTDKIIADQPGGWDYMIPGLYRCNGLPVTVCDLSHSKYRGNVYVLWSDERNSIDSVTEIKYNDVDVFIIKSTDGGNSWSKPKRVNNDTTRTNQFMAWLTVDPVTGYLWSIFYDRRRNEPNQTDIYIAKSTDGGNTFVNFKIAGCNINESDSLFLGDYTNIAAYDGTVWSVWSQPEGIFAAVFKDTANIEDVPDGATVSDYQLSTNFPNPFTNSTTISYTLPGDAHVNIGIYNSSGEIIETLVNEIKEAGTHTVNWKPANAASGIYFYKITAGNYIDMKECIYIK